MLLSYIYYYFFDFCWQFWIIFNRFWKDARYLGGILSSHRKDLRLFLKCYHTRNQANMYCFGHKNGVICITCNLATAWDADKVKKKQLENKLMQQQFTKKYRIHRFIERISSWYLLWRYIEKRIVNQLMIIKGVDRDLSNPPIYSQY